MSRPNGKSDFEASKGSPEQQEAVARAAERRRRRYPVPDEALPPLDQVVMTHQGAMIFTDVTGELVNDGILKSFYPGVSAAGITLVWATWRVLSALAPASASLGCEPRGFHAACMMASAIRAVLAKRERRREAGTI